LNFKNNNNLTIKITNNLLFELLLLSLLLGFLERDRKIKQGVWHESYIDHKHKKKKKKIKKSNYFCYYYWRENIGRAKIEPSMSMLFAIAKSIKLSPSIALQVFVVPFGRI
jgi:hypothetical protein